MVEQVRASGENMGETSPVLPASWRGQTNMNSSLIPLPTFSANFKYLPRAENSKCYLDPQTRRIFKVHKTRIVRRPS